MKIIALNGSPRRNGNTTYLLNTLIDEVKLLGHNAECIYLHELKIADCNGCLVCEETECSGDCSIADDMQAYVLPNILTADAVVFGTPTYFDMPTAQMKRFMDRSNMFLNKIIRKNLIYGLVIVGQSEFQSLNAASHSIKRYCDICNMKEVRRGRVRVIARDEGDVRKNNLAIKSVKLLAQTKKRIKGSTLDTRHSSSILSKKPDWR